MVEQLDLHSCIHGNSATEDGTVVGEFLPKGRLKGHVWGQLEPHPFEKLQAVVKHFWVGEDHRVGKTGEKVDNDPRQIPCVSNCKGQQLQSKKLNGRNNAE